MSRTWFTLEVHQAYEEGKDGLHAGCSKAAPTGARRLRVGLPEGKRTAQGQRPCAAVVTRVIWTFVALKKKKKKKKKTLR
eukprot:NODE_985_length_721_cov_1293.534226_g670_i2.p3 GENE.NODE_985_length_721_cov_1293.534226_g670_i2~~NODE_985_length_721_cov_1293.534226_g670_i2.p3  ORF type:complete len:80 (-),score=31.73 NODE_985_length_721_cov_1293.534226_g670_i2:5-244(-)